MAALCCVHVVGQSVGTCHCHRSPFQKSCMMWLHVCYLPEWEGYSKKERFVVQEFKDERRGRFRLHCKSKAGSQLRCRTAPGLPVPFPHRCWNCTLYTHMLAKLAHSELYQCEVSDFCTVTPQAVRIRKNWVKGLGISCFCNFLRIYNSFKINSEAHISVPRSPRFKTASTNSWARNAMPSPVLAGSWTQPWNACKSSALPVSASLQTSLIPLSLCGFPKMIFLFKEY